MDQGIDFSTVKQREELHGYIPQVKVDGFVFPVLACDINGIDEDVLSWKDAVNGYSPHSLVHDVQEVTGLKETPHAIFSIVKQWKVDHQRHNNNSNKNT